MRGSLDELTIEVDLLAPEAERIVGKSPPLDVIARDIIFGEGPVWDARNRQLFFTDIIGDTIWRWKPRGGLKPVLRPSVKANGMCLDRENRLVVAGWGGRTVFRFEQNGSRTVLAERWEGKKLSSPNDIVVKSDGSIWFTDPPGGLLNVGMVGDDLPFDEVLSADILYVGAAGLGLPAASASNNDHYEQMEARGVNLRTGLRRTTQSGVYGTPPAATAGVMTTRAAAQSFFIAGTNRAMFRFTLLNHMCRDLEEVQDTSRPPDRIRQDVSRSPGGDARLFLNNCVGCHSGMDPMAQAFAYYTFDEAQGRLVYTAGDVQPKYFNNDTTFASGYRTPDDAWENRWRKGQNALLGWDAALPGTGNGAKTLGQEFGASDAFAACQVEKVFRAVCLRAPQDGADRSQLAAMASSFRAGGYRLKQPFADAATYCMGD